MDGPLTNESLTVAKAEDHRTIVVNKYNFYLPIGSDLPVSTFNVSAFLEDT
jgi:hypothetical protein